MIQATIPNPSEEDCYLGQFIPLHYHHCMLTSEYRMTAFKAAIEQTVFPGAKVLDLGGGTGVLSWFAAAHASKVWCVEFNPDLVREARRLLKLNPGGDKVEVVHGDAYLYLPPEPVDVVICEMLHPGLLVEKQVNVINSFKQRYSRRFGSAQPLPRFIPDFTLLAVQPLQQDFNFMGFHAPIIQFQQIGQPQTGTTELAPYQLYSTLDYTRPVSEEIRWEGLFTLEKSGQVNALRFITKNILAAQDASAPFVEWHNPHMILALAEPVQAEAGGTLQVSFSYRTGGSLASLQNTIATVLKVPGE